MPGKMPPTTDPTPGKLSAGPKLPLLGRATGGPRVALKPGNPNSPPGVPGPTPKVPAEPPVNGYCTNGWLNAGRNTAVFTKVPTFGPDGDRTMAGPLPKNGNLSCEFGR